MLRTPTFGRLYREPELAVRPAQRADDRSRPTAVTLRSIRDALREGLAAHRRYEHLRSEGVHHDPAIRQAFGISHPASASEERRRRHGDCRAGSPA